MNGSTKASGIEITPEMIDAGVWAFGAYADELVAAVPESSLAALASEVYRATQLSIPGQISPPK